MVRIERRPCLPAQGGWPAHIHPVLRRIYAARGIQEYTEVEHRLARLLPPQTLSGIDTAVALLTQAIDKQQRVLIVGDYDCDGATGCAVAVRGLRLLGLQHVGYLVPNRMLHGYGLSRALVEQIQTRPDLLITVDNGINSHAGVAAAKARNIKVIVTDHHLPSPTLPDADAIVNPNLNDDAFPSKALAGVGVMFYLLLALRAHLRERGDWNATTQPELAALLDLVALGTVADMVPLDFNNRILVEAGLRRIRQGHACAGIQALIEVAGRHSAHLSAADLGFAIGPRLNAAGRLEDISVGIECLLSDTPSTASELAERLSAINRERRDLQTSMVAQAMHLVDAIASDNAIGVCVFEHDWHPGIVGLVASRLKDRLQRPVVAFAPSGNSSLELRGSARSIAGFHLRDALAEVDRREPGLIPRFGGHAMAAGLSLAASDLPRFAACFDAVARERISSELLDAVLWSDGELDTGECGMTLAQQLRHAGPWGQAFPLPLFDNVFNCIQSRPMGTGHRRLRLCDPRDHTEHDAVMFQVGNAWPEAKQLRIVYELSINDWQGRETPRLILRHVEAAA